MLMALKRAVENRPLTILSWNARGAVGKKTPELINLLQNLQVDAALIQETHLKPHHRWTVTGFTVHRTDRSSAPGLEKRQGGGTAILIADHLTGTINLPTPTTQHGLEATNAIINTQHGQVQLTSLYPPPIQ
ncbi:hypothetical protein J437_LFUL013932 [Ladona fulva]|uniref:Endonuclease/exonuclease/phosphatase domain-containing protein n=1 Tax=Ladona fulva TaxID=123851 RepID=A0A8K0KGY2_LADFU|nr:hypothetical protein J437_LFUL013932 [Ladona fulva]